LIKYTIREARSAKKVRLKVSVHRGLEVIVPRGFSRRRIRAIIREEQEWIEKALSRAEEQRKLLAPELISLKAIQKEWRVEYRGASAPWASAVERSGLLIVRGNIGDPGVVAAALRRWLSRKAHAHLVPWLHSVSEELRLPFNKVRLKARRPCGVAAQVRITSTSTASFCFCRRASSGTYSSTSCATPSR
jgi:predicted metal-dependent hydrolase